MIGNDAIVFDGVAHVFNFEKKNALGPAGEMFNNHLYAFHATLTPPVTSTMPAPSPGPTITRGPSVGSVARCTRLDL